MRSKEPIDYQLDYMERLFWEIRCKKTESYVIHRIWDRLNDDRIRFEIQQKVKFPNGKIALADLYLPQLGIFVEVNEPYHESQKEADDFRNKELIDVTQCTQYIIRCGNPDKPGEWLSLQKIHEQIDQCVELIKEKIAHTPDLKPWSTSEWLTVEYHKQKGVLHVGDSLRTIDDVCAVFGAVPKHRGFLRVGATPVPGKNDLDIWYPIANNGKGWINERRQSDEVIAEYHENEAKRISHVSTVVTENKQRVVFFRDEDALGMVLYRFLGVYQLDIPESKKQNKCIWKRINTEYSL